MVGDSSVSWKVSEPSVDLANVPEMAWTDAVRRANVIRILAENTHRTVADVRAAAKQLGCGLTQVYAMLRRYRIEPTTSSLLPRRPGPCTGTSRLSPRLDSIIEQAIESTYLSMQRPRVADLVAEVRRLCHSRQVVAPSRKAIMARVSKRPRADILKRREGSKAARDRLAP